MSISQRRKQRQQLSPSPKILYLAASCSSKMVRIQSISITEPCSNNDFIELGESFEGRPAATSGGELNLSDPTLVQKTHSKTAQKMLKSQKQPPAATLFMGNLGFETTDESIRQLLNAHKPGNKKGKNVSKPVNEEKEKDEEKDDDEKDLEKAAPVEVPAPKDAPEDDWIRQVRMGTFEDSGMCKGYVHVYPASPPPHTHTLYSTGSPSSILPPSTMPPPCSSTPRTTTSTGATYSSSTQVPTPCAAACTRCARRASASRTRARRGRTARSACKRAPPRVGRVSPQMGRPQKVMMRAGRRLSAPSAHGSTRMPR